MQRSHYGESTELTTCFFLWSEWERLGDHYCPPTWERWSSSSEFYRILKEFSSSTRSEVDKVTSQNHTVTVHRKAHPENISILIAWNLVLPRSFKISVNVETDTEHRHQQLAYLEPKIIKALSLSTDSFNMHTDVHELTTECLVWMKVFPNYSYCFTVSDC